MPPQTTGLGHAGDTESPSRTRICYSPYNEPQRTQENKCTVSHEKRQEKVTLRSHKSHQEKVALSGSHVGRQTGALNQLFSIHTGFKVKGGCSERTHSGLDRDIGIVTNRRTEILQLTSTIPEMFLIH